MIVLTDLLSFLQHHICLMRKGFGKMLLVGKSNNIRHSKSATVQVVQHEDDHDTAVFLLMSCFLSFQSSTKPIFASIIRECFFFSSDCIFPRTAYALVYDWLWTAFNQTPSLFMLELVFLCSLASGIYTCVHSNGRQASRWASKPTGGREGGWGRWLA